MAEAKNCREQYFRFERPVTCCVIESFCSLNPRGHHNPRIAVNFLWVATR